MACCTEPGVAEPSAGMSELILAVIAVHLAWCRAAKPAGECTRPKAAPPVTVAATSAPAIAILNLFMYPPSLDLRRWKYSAKTGRAKRSIPPKSSRQQKWPDRAIDARGP